ncbi:MAG TPA: PAS domain S-box protein [Chitinophagaceae bacterium]|nr:PAS domain S-box protein [Chitinophagaceae bacterium]
MRTELSEIKQLLRDRPDGAGQLLALLDEEGVVHSANTRLQRLLHLNTRGNKVNLLELVPAQESARLRDQLRHATALGRSGTLDLHLKNGQFHPLRWQLFPLSSRLNGKVVCLCIGRELAEWPTQSAGPQSDTGYYHLLLETLEEGVLVHDQHGEILSVSEEAAAILGTTCSRVLELKDIKNLWKTHGKITTEEGRILPVEDAPFMRALRTGQPQARVLRLGYAGRPDRLILFKSKPLFNPGQDQPFSVVSGLIDVTDDRNFALRVREREALFHSFMKHSPNLVWVIDEDDRLVFSNQAFNDYFHLPGSVLDEQIVPLLPRQVISALYNKHREVMASGHATSTLQEIELADGSTFMFHINLFPIEGLEGKKMVGGHAINLAEKYALEQQLREAHDRLMLLTRATSDAIWEWDMPSGRIFRNDKLMEMIGYHSEESQGLAWWLRRIHPQDRDRVSDKVRDVTDRALQSWEDEYRFKCADGQYKQIHDRGYVVYENGLPVKMIGSLHDVSEIRQLQQRLQEEKRERQKEISEIMISVQEQERSHIAYELHDNVNQILSTAKLFIDMLRSGEGAQRELKQKATQYLEMAIEEIRKLSKEMAAPQLKGNGLIDSLQALVDDIHFSNAIHIAFSHHCDARQLSSGKTITLFRIVQEQLKNILKYSQATEAAIRLDCQDDQVCLVIEDNGQGFDAQQTRRGIGLSNIYERARFYHGTVELDTAPGRGCRLTVRMPVQL